MTDTERVTHQVTVKVTEYGERAMFMRSIRAEGTTEDGREIEVAVNELGAGIIVRIGDRTFVFSEFALVDGLLEMEEAA